MAKDDDKTVVDNTETMKNSDDESKNKSGGNKKIMMFAGVGVGAIIIGLALALFVVKPMMSSDTGDEGDTTEEVEKSKDNNKEAKKKPKKKSHGDKAEVSTYIYTISDIVINPAGTGGTRYLSVSFGFELESELLVAKFEDRESIIRDALITILSSKTVAHLTDLKQKEIIRYQIEKRVSKIMKTNELAGVYYTDFVLQ